MKKYRDRINHEIKYKEDLLENLKGQLFDLAGDKNEMFGMLLNEKMKMKKQRSKVNIKLIFLIFFLLPAKCVF